MVESELHELIERIAARQCETQTTEVKTARGGCPEKLYDTISAFSNQDSGGVFVFGLNEQNGFEKSGVYDAQDLQKKVMEYCEQMTPVVRPVFTVCEEDGHVFVSAEIPPLDIAERPCFKTAKGRLQGSYIRVGDADKPMTEYEIYSYEAYRKKYRDDIRIVEGASLDSLDDTKTEEFLILKKQGRAHLNLLPQEKILELTGITREGKITLAAMLLFGIYPQAFFPQLAIAASCIPGTEIGQTDPAGRRFTDTKRIEGTLPDMLDGALAFVRSNMKVSTRIDPLTGIRTDILQYPMDAVREAVLNALVHRDYSFHTEGQPIQLLMFSDRLEIRNPGGLYGRLTLDQLGNVQPDTRNPVIVTDMETLRKAENRYSGIPTIRFSMKQAGLPEPVFQNNHGEFAVILFNTPAERDKNPEKNGGTAALKAEDPRGLISFCKTPRSRNEIAEHLGIPSVQYALRKYLQPLVECGLIRTEYVGGKKRTGKKYVSNMPE